MTRSTSIPTLVVLLVVFGAATVQAHHSGNLTGHYTTDLADYDVRFTAANPYDCTLDEIPADADRDFLPAVQAIRAGEALDSGQLPEPGKPAGYHAAYENLQFATPILFGTENEVLIYDCAPGGTHDDNDCDSGNARSSVKKILMPATTYCDSSEQRLRMVMGHELFHHVQFASGANSDAWGRLAFEGSARVMEDAIYSDVDQSSSSLFAIDTNRYLGNPNQELWRSHYQSGLAWKYLTEQFGTNPTEPQVGVDFVREFWAQVTANKDNPDVPATLESTIQSFSPDTTLREWFGDFAIANIAKEYDMSAIPDSEKYMYIDESNPGATAYRKVARRWSGNIQANAQANVAISRWGAAYFQADIALGCVPGYIFGFRAQGGADLSYAALFVNSGDEVESMVRGKGEEFAVAKVQRGTGLGDPFASLVVAVIGGDEQSAFARAFDCAPGSMSINRPNATYKAFVGPNEEPRSMQIRLSISGSEALGGAVVKGILADDFTVYIGTNGEPADQAQVLGGKYVGNEFWLDVVPPVKPDEDVYDLTVAMGAFHVHVQSDAVSYERRVFDQILVLDKSGSMSSPPSSPRLDAAKAAAELYVDLSTPADRLGLVSFNGDADVEQEMDTANFLQRILVKNQIGTIGGGGGTAIGEGLYVGLGQIASNGSSVGEDWLILLSDGQENEPLFWLDIQDDIKAAGLRVNAIALGQGSDQVLMQEIAKETGGEYYYVDDDETGQQRDTTAPTSSQSIRLADTFASAHESMKKRQRLFDTVDGLERGETHEYTVSVSGGGMADGHFVWQWTDANALVDITVTNPDGVVINDAQNGVEVRTSDTSAVYHLRTLTPGNWRIAITANDADTDYLAIVSGDDRLSANLDVRFGPQFDGPFATLSGARYLRGLPQPVRATVQDRSGLILGASVVANIEHPDGALVALPLFDDGAHDDGRADDGVYGNTYTRTTAYSLNDLPDEPPLGARGSYNVTVTADGQDNSQQSFSRIRKMSFQVFETDQISTLPPSDIDADGMPDRYEDLHACLDRNIDDANDDADEDSIVNIASYEAGYDPCHSDTDRGGETDASELARGANVFDPSDDAIHRPVDAEVIDWIYEHIESTEAGTLKSGANLIRYQVHPDYVNIRLLRSLSATGPFAPVAMFPAFAQGGLYSDTGLANGTTYYYKIQPINESGSEAAPSHVFSGTPNDLPIPPIGALTINGGATSTQSVEATLAFTANNDVTSMMVSNHAQFLDAAWQPIENTLAWTLEPSAITQFATVFVRYMDASGNVSPTDYFASIEMVDPASVGLFSGSARLQGETTHANIVGVIAQAATTTPVFTNADGRYAMQNIAPGEYDVHFSYPGYIDAQVTGVLSAAGDTTNLPDVVLIPASDLDEDGVLDFEDNCMRVANPDQYDSNGDGFGNLCDADYNGDCIANVQDLAILRANFFSSNPDTDMNGDGSVNTTDLGIFRSLFFLAPGPSGLGDCSPGN